MSTLKLTIDLLPKGAWGNNLREGLSQKDWDMLRNICYQKARHRCTICGKGGDLEAHEVWDFDIESKTQTLEDIIALCPACHGVKHMRNSERIGYGEQSKAHFLKVNECSQLIFAKHYTEAQILFEQRNNVLRWKLSANLDRFGGKGLEIKQRIIPLIINPYDGVDWETEGYFNTLQDDNLQNLNIPKSKIRSIDVNNHKGTITVVSDYQIEFNG